MVGPPSFKCTWAEAHITIRRPSVRRRKLFFYIFDFSSETAERNLMKLDRTQDPYVLYHVCVFRADRENKMAAQTLIGWSIFDYSSETPNGIQRNFKRSKISASSIKFCVFRANRENEMAAVASDWLRNFRRLLWNHWTEFNETRFQCHLPNLCCFGGSEKQNDHLCLCFGSDIFEFSSATAERNSWKLDIKQDST